ncbi:hypothetical protein HT576_21775 [Haloterrigena sp. SYSU A121-1]|uniref:Uncharacterized protein n=1 Tax=Haloterrigena gelatinilytica TaxID=2741724 RepID=A0A8J8GR21_9EURY|nr:hypothetical protein [Haloterrigena gelatinilytica]NUB93615.1 hypothetical protein [Haloterrigena gelatinilytica]
MVTRRQTLKRSAGVLTVAAVTGHAMAQSEEHVLELLAEVNVDHEHACLHGDYDDRVSLEAGSSAEEATTVDETHVVWEVTYQNDGYVAFDIDGYANGDSFVFYTADGSARAVSGTEIERKSVTDCDSLDEYVKIEPEDGKIVLELIADSDDTKNAEDDSANDSGGGDPDHESDDRNHGDLVGNFEIVDRETDSVVADLHGDHWHGNLPEIPVDSHLSLGAIAEDSDGEEIPIGENEEYRLNATIAESGQEGIITVDSHGDHLHMSGEGVGSTDVVFQLWHGDHVDWESPPIAADVIEGTDDEDSENSEEADNEPEESEENQESEESDGPEELEVDVSVSSPKDDKDGDARFHVTTRNHGDSPVETTIALDIVGMSESATVSVDADDCQATWLCIGGSDLSAGKHEWTITAGEETVTGTLSS